MDNNNLTHVDDTDVANINPIPYNHPKGAVIWVNLEDKPAEDK